MTTSRARSSSAVSSSPISVWLLGVDRAGVQARLHRHQADPRLGVPFEDGPLDRRRPPPPGQQGEVEVDQGEAVEHGGRDDATEGHHHAQFGADLGDPIERIGHRQAQLQSGGLHRTGDQLRTPDRAACPAG